MSFLLIMIWLLGLSGLGPLLAARLCRYTVSEFTLGVGISLFQFSLGRTRYELKLIPLAAQVRTPGGESNGQLLVFALAGPFMLFFTGALSYLILLLIGIDVPSSPGALVVDAGSAANLGGLRSGDIILKVDDQVVQDRLAMAAQMRHWHSGQRKVEIQRAGQILTLDLQRNEEKVEGTILTFSSVTERKHFKFGEAFRALPELVLLSPLPRFFSTYFWKTLKELESPPGYESNSLVPRFGMVGGFRNFLFQTASGALTLFWLTLVIAFWPAYYLIWDLIRGQPRGYPSVETMNRWAWIFLCAFVILFIGSFFWGYSVFDSEQALYLLRRQPLDFTWSVKL